jgi:hypothetical protein
VPFVLTSSESAFHVERSTSKREETSDEDMALYERLLKLGGWQPRSALDTEDEKASTVDSRLMRLLAAQMVSLNEKVKPRQWMALEKPEVE